MAKTASEIAAKFGDQMLAGERIAEIIDKGVTCKFDNSASLPAYVAITDRRLIVIQKRGFGKKTLSVELSQIIEFSSAGAIIPKLTLATTGGQRVFFTAMPKDKIALIQAAIGAARNT